MSASAPAATAAGPSNGELIRRLFALTWRYRLGCVRVLAIQLVLLTMGIGGLSFTGLGIDYIRHKVSHVALAPSRMHVLLPDDWSWQQVLGLLAGLILVLALARALLNYV